MHSPSRQTEERVQEKTSSKTVDPIETENTFQKVVFVEKRQLPGLIYIYQYSNYSILQILYETENTDFKKFHNLSSYNFLQQNDLRAVKRINLKYIENTFDIQLNNYMQQQLINQNTSAQIIISKQQTVYEARIQIFIPK
ncbi:Hypothetical_protein [Hexamita inflata]|uniref:Hypothetical_protein n=1 Tax=Hexamita inflata TaxID=28002 RepID=A0AA86U1E5_9EUKA|nr:Hypothetical protein HINF_LOCUS24121 [Hexamita inflata]